MRASFAILFVLFLTASPVFGQAALTVGSVTAAQAPGTVASGELNVEERAVGKTKETPELMDVFDYQQRVKLR